MFTQHIPGFPHRLTHDGYFDSVCNICMVTVASALYEDELAPYEFRHTCNPARITELGHYTSHSVLTNLPR
jgi:hypothetical protein